MTPGPSTLAALMCGLAGIAATVEPAPEDVSPGVLGFLVTLAVVLACIPLFRSMTSKIRGVEFRDPESRTEGEPDRAAPPEDPPPARP